MRESLKLDNLFEQDLRDEFYDVMSRRQPSVIVVGGLTMATCKLSRKVKEIVAGKVDIPPPVDGHNHNTYPPVPSQPMALRADLGIPVIYVQDDLARMYANSSRASQEFPAFSTTGKYCVGLARYTQSPLNEFAALGADITAITFLESEQQLVPREKLLSAFERVLVDITNKVGVDINRAVADSYYAHLLPFVCGLGPRKAQALIKKIGALVYGLSFLKDDPNVYTGWESYQPAAVHQERDYDNQDFLERGCISPNCPRGSRDIEIT